MGGNRCRRLPPEKFAGQVPVARGGEPEVADVDPLVGVMDKRPGLEQRHVALGEEPVGDAVGELLAEPA